MRRPAGLALLLAVLTLATGPGSLAAAPARAPRSVSRQQLDSLATATPSPTRDRAMGEWAKRATLADIVWVLRRPASELGGAELPLVEAALALADPSRTMLRQRLLARRALALPHPAKRGELPPPDLAALRPEASVYRVAALFPDAGEYAAFGCALRSALAAGLTWDRPAGAATIELDTLGTGDSDPALVAAALEHAAPRVDVVVGELLSGPTLSLATATRLAGMVLVSPTATDERIGGVGPGVFQVGPSAATRAHALAEVVLGGAPHTLAIAGSATLVRGAFAEAFAREIVARGGKVARRDVVPAGAATAAHLATTLAGSGADVLLWDGPSRDAETLVRALATAGAALRLCGGPALAPEAMRPATRTLLEGVVWVADDWQLAAPAQARLDSLAGANGFKPGPLWTRGWLAGHYIAAAVDAGALSAGEIAARWTGKDGWLDVARSGGTLTTFTVARGKTVSTPK